MATQAVSSNGSRIHVTALVGEAVVMLSGSTEAQAYAADGQGFPSHVAAALSESALALPLFLTWAPPDGGSRNASWLEPSWESVTVLLVLMRTLRRKAALWAGSAKDVGVSVSDGSLRHSVDAGLARPQP